LILPHLPYFGTLCPGQSELTLFAEAFVDSAAATAIDVAFLSPLETGSSAAGLGDAGTD
jgi:hypothetical protein